MTTIAQAVWSVNIMESLVDRLFDVQLLQRIVFDVSLPYTVVSCINRVVCSIII